MVGGGETVRRAPGQQPEPSQGERRAACVAETPENWGPVWPLIPAVSVPRCLGMSLGLRVRRSAFVV